LIVDCAVHPVLEDEKFNKAIGPPWSIMRLPTLLGDRYTAPFDQLETPIERAADPAAFAGVLFGEREVDWGVLAPSGRGYYPNPQQAAALATAANSLLHDEWLDCPEAGGRFLASIRIAPNDTAAAVAEIEHWAADPRFVQIVAPVRVLSAYGDERYFPIWQAAVEHGLPVFLHDDLGTLAEPAPSLVGFPRYFAEHHALRPSASVIHLSSLITSGVFDRLPDLRVVLGDVSVHFARPLLWRVDKDWKSARIEIPWVDRLPSSYLQAHARFVCQSEDAAVARGITVNPGLAAESAALTVFGSRYPYWDRVDADSAGSGLPEARDDLLAGNAVKFYPRLRALVASTA
jgi:predicted TIM-barrel fold metal-dependent hydrolase